MHRMLIALVVLACSGGSTDQLREVRDNGTLCLRSTPAADLSVQVAFSVGCLSSTCTVVRAAVCTADVAGNDIRVRSYAQIEDVGRPGGNCSDDCMPVGATCEIRAAPGNYRLIYGDYDVVTQSHCPAGPRHCDRTGRCRAVLYRQCPAGGAGILHGFAWSEYDGPRADGHGPASHAVDGQAQTRHGDRYWCRFSLCMVDYGLRHLEHRPV